MLCNKMLKNSNSFIYLMQQIERILNMAHI